MNPIRVLFVCVHNAARSQMAEAFCRHLGGECFQAESAGLEPGTLNPRVVQVMGEVGLDISGHSTKSVFDLFRQGRTYHFVVTVCDETAAERCPLFPGRVAVRMHWSFPDPSRVSGPEEECLEEIRKIRDAIRTQVAAFVAETGRLFCECTT